MHWAGTGAGRLDLSMFPRPSTVTASDPRRSAWPVPTDPHRPTDRGDIDRAPALKRRPTSPGRPAALPPPGPRPRTHASPPAAPPGRSGAADSGGRVFRQIFTDGHRQGAQQLGFSAVGGSGQAGCQPTGPTEPPPVRLLWRHGVAGGADQDRVRRGGERPPPGWGALTGGRTERRAAADITADSPFLIVFLDGSGARSPSPGAGAVIPCGCGGLAGRVRAERDCRGRSASHRAGADELLAANGRGSARRCR